METLLKEIYNDTVHITDGKVADYIPQLAEVNPEMYGIAFCDMNGNISTVIKTKIGAVDVLNDDFWKVSSDV